MRTALSIALATLVWTTGISNLVKVLVFHWNRQQLEQFCINKDRPEKNCHAHCYLVQRMGKENPHQSTISVPNPNEESRFIGSDTALLFASPLEAVHTCPGGQQSLHLTSFHPKIFRPPICCTPLT